MRARLIAALQSRVDRMVADDSFEALLEPEAVAEALALTEIVMSRDDGDVDAEGRWTLGMFHANRAIALEQNAGDDDYDRAVEAWWPLLLSGEPSLPEWMLPDLAYRAYVPAADALERGMASADPALLTDAVQAWRNLGRAYPADDPDSVGYLSNLGTGLRARFEMLGEPADLNEAVTANRTAVELTPPDDPSRPRYLSMLGAALQGTYAHSGKPADLEEAIEAGRAAVELTPADHDTRAGWLTNLGGALRARYERTGAMADLNEAIAVERRGVEATAAGDPYLGGRLANVCALLRMRFDQIGALTDLEQAVAAGRAAVETTPADHPHRFSALANLGTALEFRADRTGRAADLDEAVHLHRTTVDHIPAAHRARPRALCNLGLILLKRFDRTRDHGDLEDGIAALRSAVAAVGDADPRLGWYLSNLGVVLLRRHGQSRNPVDLDEAVAVQRDAVLATPADQPDRARYLFNLGLALQARFEQSQAAADLADAVSSFAMAAEIDGAPASDRVRAAYKSAFLLGPGSARAADLLATAVGLLGQVAPRELERGDQQFALSGLPGIANIAAAYALADTAHDAPGRAIAALTLLEQGRSVLLSQALDSRGDLADAENVAPELAQRYRELRELLDRPPGHGTVIADRHSLVHEFNNLSRRIRRLDGHESFMRPPSPQELLGQAAEGPIAICNVTSHRCDALLVRENGVTVLPLGELHLDELIARINGFHMALGAVTHATTHERRAHAQATLLDTLAWLWRVVARPILDELELTETPAAGIPWPRLWWAPGGVLGLLPLHAAGDHLAPETDTGRPTVMDRVISSYTPIIRALGHARRDAPLRGPKKALIVAMPTTPGLPGSLRTAVREAEQVRRHFPDSHLSTDGSASTPMVLEHLPTCAVSHFACHGTSDPADPSHSGLLLSDHADDRLTVARLGPVDLKSAQLAYLSACETAINLADGLLDEAIDLASSFQLAGFPRVIGTLWPVADEISMIVADTFYQGLYAEDGTLDVARSAQALHLAIRHVRDTLNYVRSPSLWAPYMHAGA